MPVSLRSRISQEQDSHQTWLQILAAAASRAAKIGGKAIADVAEVMAENARLAQQPHLAGTGFAPNVAPNSRSGRFTRRQDWRKGYRRRRRGNGRKCPSRS